MVVSNDGFRGCCKGRRSTPGEPVMRESEFREFVGVSNYPWKINRFCAQTRFVLCSSGQNNVVAEDRVTNDRIRCSLEGGSGCLSKGLP